MTKLTENLTVWELWYFKAVTSYRGKQCGKRPLAKGEWKYRVASKIHFILAGLASRNLKTLATITGCGHIMRGRDCILIFSADRNEIEELWQNVFLSSTMINKILDKNISNEFVAKTYVKTKLNMCRNPVWHTCFIPRIKCL
jgi:hypothetical protein